MDNKKAALFVLCGYIVGGLTALVIANSCFKSKEVKDDIYINKIEIDSLKDDVSKRNLIIIELNKQAQDDIKKISQLNDSDAVNVFLELTSR